MSLLDSHRLCSTWYLVVIHQYATTITISKTNVGAPGIPGLQGHSYVIQASHFSDLHKLGIIICGATLTDPQNI